MHPHLEGLHFPFQGSNPDGVGLRGVLGQCWPLGRLRPQARKEHLGELCHGDQRRTDARCFKHIGHWWTLLGTISAGGLPGLSHISPPLHNVNVQAILEELWQASEGGIFEEMEGDAQAMIEAPGHGVRNDVATVQELLQVVVGQLKVRGDLVGVKAGIGKIAPQ
jgi:hypothetical protein